MEDIIRAYTDREKELTIFVDENNNLVDYCTYYSSEEMDTVTLINEKFSYNCLFKFCGDVCPLGEEKAYRVEAFITSEHEADKTLIKDYNCVGGEISALFAMLDDELSGEKKGWKRILEAHATKLNNYFVTFGASGSADDYAMEINAENKTEAFKKAIEAMEEEQKTWCEPIEYTTINVMTHEEADAILKADAEKMASPGTAPHNEILEDSSINAMIELYESLYEPCVRVETTSKGWIIHTTEDDYIYPLTKVKEFIKNMMLDINIVTDDFAEEIEYELNN